MSRSEKKSSTAYSNVMLMMRMVMVMMMTTTTMITVNVVIYCKVKIIACLTTHIKSEKSQVLNSLITAGSAVSTVTTSKLWKLSILMVAALCLTCVFTYLFPATTDCLTKCFWTGLLVVLLRLTAKQVWQLSCVTFISNLPHAKQQQTPLDDDCVYIVKPVGETQLATRMPSSWL